ncbi:MAG: hypothetical protein GYA43_06410 [Bacteroidales bacterium]|nr:hypothetical protein [Bacteroidales bacterium]
MNVRQSIRQNRVRRAFKKLLNYDLAVFFVFLLIAFILWYLNSLRKTMESETAFRIKIENLNTFPLSDESLRAKTWLKLTGTGFILLKTSLNSLFSTFAVDAGEIRMGIKDKGNSEEYYILAADLRPVFEKSLKSDLQLVSIRPDTIFLVKVRKE